MACGEVREQETDANSISVDGSTSPIDGGASCPPGWSGDACSVFFDDFDRPTGMIGPSWDPLSGAGTERLGIISNRACSDIQAPAFLQERVESSAFSASMKFEGLSSEGLEVSFIFSREDTADNELFLAGCDGGGGECKLKIGKVGSVAIAELDVPAIVAQTVYTLSMEIENDVLTLTVNEGVTELGTVSAPLPSGFVIQRFGVITGRQPDSQITCIDDFSLDLAAGD